MWLLLVVVVEFLILSYLYCHRCQLHPSDSDIRKIGLEPNSIYQFAAHPHTFGSATPRINLIVSGKEFAGMLAFLNQLNKK